MFNILSSELFIRWNILLLASALLGFAFSSNILTAWQSAFSYFVIFFLGVHTYLKTAKLVKNIEFIRENDEKREDLISSMNLFMEGYTNNLSFQNFNKKKLINELSNYLELQKKVPEEYEPLKIDYYIGEFNDAVAEIENMEEKKDDQKILDLIDALTELKKYKLEK